MTRQPPANPRLHSVNKTKKPRALRATARPDAAIAGAAAAGAARGNARSAAARPSITPPIIIQLDPATPVGEVNGRFDMLLRGQIVASEMIEEAALHHAGRVVATLRFVPADHASETMGNGLRVLRQCFQFNLALTPEQAAGRCKFEVAARCAGIVRHEAFEVEIGAGRVTPLAGGFHRGIDTAGAASPAILFIETASVGRRGALRLEGWAVSRSPLVAIHAFAGDARIGTARLGGIREDVVNAYPGYPNARTSGFVFRSPPGAAVGPGDVVRLQASCLHGASKDVLVVLADGGGADDATGDAVCRYTPDGVTPEGAALDGVTPEEAASDGVTPEEAASDGVTPDGAALPGQPAARRGAMASGEDRVRMSSRGTVRMYCERASVYEDGRVLAVGWAVCPDGMARIDIRLDGQPIGRAEMGIERLDVGEEYAGIEMA
ncbi:MAG TPA: hypothetical protein VN702_03785, partial [Acetobacteraceae bacterium]|nr:hypothetical protein [Acetobacteraceae bacterium]